MWMTYDEMRTVTARASGSFHSVGPPRITKNRPTAQPTSTLIMRLLNIRTASVTCGSDAAIIEAMAQIGLVSAMFSSTYQTMVVAMKTFSAKRIPTMSRRNLGRSHLLRWMSGIRGSLQHVPIAWNHVVAGGAPLQWRVMVVRTV